VSGPQRLMICKKYTVTILSIDFACFSPEINL
jgi:hypothetical protein